MTDAQFERLLTVMNMQAFALWGIYQCFQASNIKSGQPGAANFNDLQKMLNSAASLSVPPTK